MKYIDGTTRSNTVAQATNVAEYVIARLVDLGITECFGLPGDYAFGIDRAAIHNKNLNYIGCNNELNASYAADGYARMKGAAMLTTTFGVGELSALNGVMGAKAENVVIFHLVGGPSTALQVRKKNVHHTLGDGDFTIFKGISEKSACVSAVITADNVVLQMDQIIHEAFKKRQPAYILMAYDESCLPLRSTHIENENVGRYISNKIQLAKAVHLILDLIEKSQKIVVIPAVKLRRFNLESKGLQLVEKLGCPFVVMPQAKSVFDELHPQYLGYFFGEHSYPGVEHAVEEADLIIDLGEVSWNDINTGLYTAKVDLRKKLILAPEYISYGELTLSHVFLSEVLHEIIPQISQRKIYNSNLQITNNIEGHETDKITLTSFYSRFLNFFHNDDVLIVETGSSSLGLPSLHFPKNVHYNNQTLWGSIGWATGATLGVCLANPQKRVLLLTGEGSHQLTATTLGTMGRYKTKPIIFCSNNDGYTVERGLDLDKNYTYNDIEQWNYTELPAALGCKDWLTFKVFTNAELDQVLIKAASAQTAVYIEFFTDKMDFNNILESFHKKYFKA
ncbi:MAG: thiamine pyrophosphate-binding protein [Sediminibacterium sp.]|nr:thiamine pyrophosphate-binding protein [Sediminibacterium sp.]